jgi:large subunit ribosomal protein L40e
MATATFTLPVPWRAENQQGLSGVVEVNSSDFESEGLVEARVRDLIAILNNKIKLLSSGKNVLPEVKRLLFHGVEVRSNSLVETLVPELMCSSPRLMATTQLRLHRVPGVPMTIFVNTLGGKPASLHCTSTATVADVKTRIEVKEGVPCKDQRLMYPGKQLQDDLTLSFYHIRNEATLHLSFRLLGGISGGFTQTFADVSDGSIITARAFSPTAPKWRRCSKGLNIEGRCTNEACRAFRRMVIDPKRFDLFNLVRDDNVKCPIFRCKVKPVTCGLYDCTWRYKGMKKADGLSICSQWMDARGYVYHRFNADETHGSVEWASLVLVAKPRTEPVTAHLLRTESVQVSKGDLCSICYSPFGSRKTTTTRCGHTFHLVCSQMWDKCCKERNTQPSCAICRRST